MQSCSAGAVLLLLVVLMASPSAAAATGGQGEAVGFGGYRHVPEAELAQVRYVSVEKMQAVKLMRT